MYRKPTMAIILHQFSFVITLTRYSGGLGLGFVASVFVVSSVFVSIVFNRFNGDNNSSILSLIVLGLNKEIHWKILVFFRPFLMG